jgi:hypothetical protein
MVARVVLLFAGAALLAGACSTGPEAPPVAATDLFCTETFCISSPSDWVIEDEGETYVVFHHPSDPEKIRASASGVNMEGLVTANGGTWPQAVSGVVDAFWAALDGGNATLAETRALEDGSVESVGAFESGRLWFRLIGLDSVNALGVEVRGPNSSWESHAVVFLDSFEPLGS